MTVMVLLACGVGVGVLLIVRGVVPPRVDLAVAVGRWDASRRLAALTAQRAESRTLKERTGRWLADRLHRYGVELPSMREDLAILNRSLEGYLVGLLVTFVFGVFFMTCAGAVFALIGIPLGFAVPVGVGLAFGGILVFANAVQLHRDAEARRAQMRHTLTIYLNLVRMSLASGRGLPEALPMAAQIGSGWTFDLLAETLRHSRNIGQSAWVGWDQLGARIGVAELRDLGASVELVGEEGARVQESLAARAETLRQRELDADFERAEQFEESMKMAAMVMVIGLLTFIGFPAIMTILAA